jgi:hypothetical protein
MQWPTEKGQTTIYKILQKKNKDQELRTQSKTGDDLMCSGRVAVSVFLVAPVVLLQLQKNGDKL